MKKTRSHIVRAALALSATAVVSVLSMVLYNADAPEAVIALIYCLAGIVIAWLTHSLIYSAITTVLAVVSYNFFFTDPYFSFSVYDEGYVVTFATLAAVALLASWLTLHARRSALIAHIKKEESERERYRANLLRSISHDIRTPLAAIIGTAEILERETETSDSRRGLIKSIRDEADWLRSLVENILSLTRLQDERGLPKQQEAAEEIVGSAIGHVMRRMPERTIDVDVPEELLLVPMEAKLIEQVLINLLDNAARHTAPEGGITVAVREVGGAAEFSVFDEGEGIEDVHLPKLFDTFYTTRDAHADASHGVGLGLAICRTIVEAHGGKITAQNRTDRTGAEVSFILPL